MPHGERAKIDSNKQREFWSRRCPQVNGMRINSYGKDLTHRKERRDAKKESEERKNE